MTEVEAQRLENKAHLKQIKARAEDAQSRMAESARAFDEGIVARAAFLALADSRLVVELTRLTPKLEEAQTLTRSVRGMELELAMLRSSRPEKERITIPEANQILEDQVNKLREMSAHLSASKAKLAADKAKLATAKQTADAKLVQRHAAEAAAASVRDASQDRDGSLAESCKWYNRIPLIRRRAAADALRRYKASHALLSSLLGVRGVTTHRDSIAIAYSLSETDPTQTATLSLRFTPDTRLVGAEVRTCSGPVRDADQLPASSSIPRSISKTSKLPLLLSRTSEALCGK